MMATVDIDIEIEPGLSENERVYLWRLEELERAGYDLDTALELAGRSDVDLHRAARSEERRVGKECRL